MGTTMLMRVCVLLAALAGGLAASVYEVGPGKHFGAIGEVPWESLQPGDSC